MIQRIQTLYLLGVAVLFTLLLFLPIGNFVTVAEEFRFDTMGVYGGADQTLQFATWALFAMSAAVALIALFTIGLYRKRMVQIRLSIFNGCMMLGFYGVAAFFIWGCKEKFAADFSIGFALSFPLVAFILNWLAVRSIGADEALVRSLNRIR